MRNVQIVDGRTWRELGIYIHIPFCVRKCAYCDFLSAPAAEEIREAYVEKLIGEIEIWRRRTPQTDGDSYLAVSVFLGGGTPSILTAGQTGRILDAVYRTFTLKENAEITIECNPGTLTKEKLEAYRRFGVNRLSIGLQSTEDEELRCLGRIHTYEVFEENFLAARKAGFTNINIDLMSAIPGQTPESWEKGLRKVLALGPEHVSAYSLIIEEGTPFYDRYHAEDQARQLGEETKLLPSEEDERKMYRVTKKLLGEAGLQRYEISNYARPGYESVHNSGYWLRREYIGLGLGASSQLGMRRSKNTGDLASYLKGVFTGQEMTELSIGDCMEETMFLGLRMCRGVDPAAFRETFGTELQTVYGSVIGKLVGEKLLSWNSQGCLTLTERGTDLANYVMAQFLID